MKKNIVCLLLAFTSFFSISASPVSALAKFSTKYQVNYTVYSSGTTHVKFLINQVNNLSVVYATEYSLSINHTKISNVRVSDENLSLIPSVIKTRNGSIISFPFVNKIVGKDKPHFFTIEYDTEDVTNKIGNTWEINIPKLDPDENTVDYNIILTLPQNFPQIAYIDPKPTAIVDSNFYFSGKTMGNKPISAVFGQEQFYKVSLSYHLQNNSNKKMTQKIALPPDTGYQKVAIDRVEPVPLDIETDADGNWLASYELKPQESVDVSAVLFIKVSFLPATKNTSVPQTYLSSNSIWNYDDLIFTIPEVQNLKTAKDVYDYVVDKFTYDFNKINKQKSQKSSASESLKNPESAICTDFTNTFIAIARKIGIPARELQGYALSENPDLKPLSLEQDILHSWPEYFDTVKNTWVQVDPTWAKTTQGTDYFNKLDFNHIVFVIHGNDPNSPIVAGGYKNGSNNQKDVFVEPIDYIEFPTAQVQILDTKVLGDKIDLEITNKSNVGFFGDVSIEKNSHLSGLQTNLYVAPFSSEHISVPLRNRPFITKTSIQTIIYINGERTSQNITVEPYFTQTAFFAGFSGILASAGLTARYLYLRRRKR